MGEMVKSHYGNLFPQELSIRALLSFSRHALWLPCYAYDGFFFGLPGINSSRAFSSNSVCNKNKLHTPQRALRIGAIFNNLLFNIYCHDILFRVQSY